MHPIQAIAFAPAMLASITGAVSKLTLCFGAVGTACVALWLLVWLGMIAWSFRTPGMRACLAGAFLVGLVIVYALMVPHAGEVLAIGVWAAIAAAVAVVVAWAVQRREVPLAFAMLLVSLVAFGLGRWNSDNVSMIREDRSAELAAARQRQLAARRAEAQKLRSRAADIRFAEDDANDAMDAAGYSDQELEKLESSAEPEYRRRGKRQRNPNQIDESLPAIDAAVAGLDDDDAPPYRYLPGDDYVLANQLDLMNRFAVWLTLVTALLLAAVEYLRRFNDTFGSILPLPIANRTIDAIWAKTHSVLLLNRGDAEALGTDGTSTPSSASSAFSALKSSSQPVAEYLETAVRKGESFIVFTRKDPWPERTHLPRLPGTGRLRALGKIAARAGEPACEPELVLESAWYGRYAFVLLADGYAGPAAEALGEIMNMLQMRLRTRARARRSVHLVWDVPEAPPAEVVKELAFLCRETNLKLVAVADDPGAWPAEAFEETFGLAAG